MPLLSTELRNPDAVPYFLWDDPMTVQEFRALLEGTPEPQRTVLMAKLLREARDEDVWLFTTPQEVFGRREQLYPLLGRRRAFWQYLLEAWYAEGLVA